MADIPITLVDLNRDVLACIMSFLSPQDAIFFSYTCKRAHAIPIHPALHTVVLEKSPEQIAMFRDYLFAADGRSNFMRSLSLAKGVTWEITRDSTDSACALADILEQATKLQHFSCGSIDNLIRASKDRVADSLVSLEGLSGLTLLGGGKDVIANIKSLNLRELTLQGNGQVSFDQFFKPIARFRHLQVLYVSNARGIFSPSPPRTTLVISSVHTLSLSEAILPMSLMVSVFPNVRRVTFRSDRYMRRTPIGGPSDPFRLDPPLCWAHTLDEAHVDVIDLDLWPLSCRVNWLELDMIRSGYSPEALLAVDQTKPRVLTCGYRIDTDNLFWVRLPMIATELRFLDVRILELSGKPKRYMLIHLARFPALTAVFLAIRAYYQPEDVEEELANIAHDLASTNAKLGFIGISLVDSRSMREEEPVYDEERRSSRWWIVERDLPNTDMTDPVRLVREKRIPTAVGLQIRDFMYAVDYDSSNWEKMLKDFVQSKLV